MNDKSKKVVLINLETHQRLRLAAVLSGVTVQRLANELINRGLDEARTQSPATIVSQQASAVNG